MNPLLGLRQKLRALFRRSRLDDELGEEMRFHVENQVQRNLEAGLSPEEAREEARRQFGGVDQIKEYCRDEWSFDWLVQFAKDIQFASRSLRKNPGFTLTVLLIIALCMAANVTIYSIVNRVLLRPLPFYDPERLVSVNNSYPKAGIERGGASVPHYIERKREITAFADTALIRVHAVTLNATEAPERIGAALVTPSFFHVLGVTTLGRTFTDDEALIGKNQVVLLSDEFWHEHFNGETSAIGGTLRLDNTPYTIIGVMPPRFRHFAYDAKLWMPLVFLDDERKGDNRHAYGGEMIARLRPGATLAEAQAQIDALNERSLKTDPMGEQVLSVGFHTMVRNLQADPVAESRPVFLILQSCALFLLLIGTVNLANLFMVRASARTKEYSLRQMLGAGRAQLARMLIIEALMLSCTGGLLGIGLAAGALRSIPTLAAGLLPIDLTPRIDFALCLDALGMAAFLGLLLALPVIWLAVHRDQAVALTVQSRGGTTARSVHRLRHVLIVTQIALAFVLLSGAGLLGLSFTRVLEVQPGFQTENCLTGAVTLPLDQYQEPRQRLALIDRLNAVLRSLPGVSAAAISTSVPFSGRSNLIAWEIGGDTAASDLFINEGLFSDWISGDFFATLGVPLREGRRLSDDDVQLGRKVCVVDEEFAHRYWPQGSALGHRLVLPVNPQESERQYVTIVGVVGSVKQDDLADLRNHGAAYFPIAVPSEFPAPLQFMVTIRSRQAPEAAGAALRAAVLHVDPSLPLYDVKSMAMRVNGSLSRRRIPLLLAGIFAAASLVLAAVGIYGVLAYTVAQRRREIGVRMALGAQPGQVLQQFLGLGLRLLAIGLPLGLIGAWWVGRAMAGLLFGIGPANPLVLGGTAAILAAVAVLACLLPARRAAGVAPNEALRAD